MSATLIGESCYAWCLMMRSIPAILCFTGGSDIDNYTETILFSQSGQISCVDVVIFNDKADEMNETFTMELIFNYAPFDIPLDTLEVTIVDSGMLAVCMYTACVSWPIIYKGAYLAMQQIWCLMEEKWTS